MELRRATDAGNWLARIGARIAQAWKFIDESDIDNHAVSIFIRTKGANAGSSDSTFEIALWTEGAGSAACGRA